MQSVSPDRRITRQPPLRYTVPGLLAVLAVLLTAVAFLHSRHTSLDLIDDGVRRRTTAMAQMTAALVRIGTEEDKPEIIRQFFGSLYGVPNLRMIAVADGTGRVLHQMRQTNVFETVEQVLETNAALIGKVRETGTREIVFDAGRTQVTGVFPVRIKGPPGPPWVALVTYDLSELKAAELSANIRRSLWMGGLALVLCLGVWAYFEWQLHRPLLALLESVAQLSQGKLDARASVGGADETARLGVAINGMARELELRDRALSQAKVDLEDSEQCLAMALKASNQGLCQCDLTQRIVRISPWLATRIGWPEAALGVPCAEWIARVHPEETDVVEEAWNEHRGGLSQMRAEYRIRSSTGGWEWVVCESRLVPGGPGLRVAGSMRVVTERKESYRLLIAQSQLLKYIAEGRPLVETLNALVRFAEAESDGMVCSIMLADINGRHLHLGAAGTLPDEFLKAVDGIDVGDGKAVCGTAAFLKQRVVVEDILKDPNCAAFYEVSERCHLRACWSTPVLGADGRLLGTFAMYYREPRVPAARHEQVIRVATHLAAIAIQRAHDDTGLRESEARFRYLADSAPVMIWMCDDASNTTYLSQPWLDFTGGTIETEMPAGWLDRVHPDDRKMCDSVWEHARVARRKFEVQFRLRHKSGDYRWLLDSGVPRFSPEGEFLGFIGCCIDVTGQRALEDHVRHSQKMESIGRLAAGVAHDFNNILTVILGNTSLLAFSDVPGVEKATEEISAAAERAAGLTRQLLVFSRQQPFQMRPMDINSVIRGFLGMLSRLVGEDVRVDFRAGGPLKPVDADPGLIEQVLLNLAVNSRDAMPGGGTLTITTDLVGGDVAFPTGRPDSGGYVRITVADTGTGIPAEILPRIFDPFFTTKEVGKGTGLGLATVYGIVDQHGGSIRAESPAGGGARFEICLPVSLGAQMPVTADGVSEALPSGSERILVVEDDPGLLKLASSFLERHGYHVTTAATGVDALNIWREKGPVFDMLITDMVMPGGLGGYQLGMLLQTEHPPLSVIYMSGYSPEFTTAANAGLTPGVDFLQKPYAMADLIRLVRSRLDRNRGDCSAS